MPVWKWVLLLIASIFLAFIMYGLAQWPTDIAPDGWVRRTVSVVVSGSNAGASLLQSTVSGPEILTGGPFGAEASIITVVLGSMLSAWFILKAVKGR